MNSKEAELQYKKRNLVSIWQQRFNEAMVTKAPYTSKWLNYIDAYTGDLFNKKGLPDYKSNSVSNYIFSLVETIRPIMLDNDPKFLALPRNPEGMERSIDIQNALLYEWDRENMNTKLYRELINTLVTGNAAFFLPWDSDSKEIKSVPVSAFNLFPDPLATCLGDAEYLIYAHYMHESDLQELYPEDTELLKGGDVKYGELVNNNNKDANLDNQILILEVYSTDKDDDNEKVGLPPRKNPGKMRVLTMAPELGLLLEDKDNVYKDNDYPFVIIKDYDVPGKFWGEGEVAQLLGPQVAMGDLSNAILDNAKSTSNMPWIIDRNSGIGVGKITNRPGLVIRKNPGTEVRREVPPAMPAYVAAAIDVYKRDLEEISGVFNSVKGTSEKGVYTAQGQLALIESGTTRIRLKVKVMEEALGRLGRMWLLRMKQFWKDDKFVTITRSEGDYDLKKFKKDFLKHDYDVKVSAGSTMAINKSAMLDLMLRLAQTQMPDGQPLVDREAVVHYLPAEVRAAILRRMGDKHVVMEQMQQSIEEMGQHMQEGFQQMQQQIEQVSQESQETDKEIMEIISEVTSAIEKINKELGITKGQVEEERMQEEAKVKEDAMRDKFYDEGFRDAEKFLTQGNMNDMREMGEIPESVLAGLEGLSDEELAMVVQDNPQLLDMLK